jgi:hypothetical protein
MEKTRRTLSFSPREKVIACEEEFLNPTTPNPKTPSIWERVASRRMINNKRITSFYNSLCKRAKTRATTLVGSN